MRNFIIMEHKGIPVLYGKAAERFEKIANKNLLKRNSIDFSKEAEEARKILEKAEL